MLKNIFHISLLIFSLIIIIPVIYGDWYLTRNFLLILMVGSGFMMIKEDDYKFPVYLHSLFYAVPFIVSLWVSNIWMDRFGWLTILFVLVGDIFYISYLRFRHTNNEPLTRPHTTYRKPAPKRHLHKNMQVPFRYAQHHEQHSKNRIRQSLHHRPIRRTPNPSPPARRVLSDLHRPRAYRAHHGTTPTRSRPQSPPTWRHADSVETRPTRP